MKFTATLECEDAHGGTWTDPNDLAFEAVDRDAAVAEAIEAAQQWFFADGSDLVAERVSIDLESEDGSVNERIDVTDRGNDVSIY